MEKNLFRLKRFMQNTILNWISIWTNQMQRTFWEQLGILRMDWVLDDIKGLLIFVGSSIQKNVASFSDTKFSMSGIL